MGSFEPTPEQRRAMEDRGGSLLVSAAAGSGKTKVLVERLFGYMERERCRIDDFLIITFTKAAAAELRGRIAAELSQRVARQPENMHLRRQMMRVYQADIKTVDAFCAGLLRENVHLLPPVEEHSLTPDFRVLDEQEAALLRQRVLGRVLEDFYAGAKDADVLLYNSTIEGVVHTTEELVAKCPLLAEFKAVQSGSVWCTTQSFFQQSTALVDFVLDLHRVFTENDPADLQFLRKVE